MQIAKILRTALLSALVLVPTLSHADNCEIAREAMKSASKIRGLKIKQDVPCLIHTQEQVKQFIQSNIKEKVPPKKLLIEERVYKALGLLPDSFDYTKGLVDLYLSQLGGYYDPDRKHFVMAGWMPEMMQPTIAAHELTHALQDQYYDLNSYLDPKSENSDEQLAHSALIEGDATAVMLDYLRALAGQPGIVNEKEMGAFMLQNVIGASLTSGMQGVPESLQLILIFPYTSGLRFAHQLMRNGGGYRALNSAFKRPPASTEEILHPEKFGKEGEFRIPTNAEFLRIAKLPPTTTILYKDTVGEFGTSVMLSSNGVDKVRAAGAAAGWAGDKVAMIRDETGKEMVVWVSRWDSPAEQEEFYNTLLVAMQSRAAEQKENALLSAGAIATLKNGWRALLTQNEGNVVLSVAK